MPKGKSSVTVMHDLKNYVLNEAFFRKLKKNHYKMGLMISNRLGFLSEMIL